MFVRDHPPPIDLPEADRQAKIERLRLAVRSGCPAAHSRKSEGDIGASRDVHFLNLKADWIAEQEKNRSQVFL
jgi:hypothetical protein